MTESTLTLLAVLTPIALFDSASITPLCIVPLVVLMGTRRPLLTSSAFLAGIFLTYVACSLLVLFGLQSMFERLNVWLAEMLKNPDTLDLTLQAVIGTAMVVFGSRMADARQSDDDRGLAEAVSPGQAFSAGATMTIVGMPGAFPLFAAVDQILRADLDSSGKVLVILIYNGIFILPLTLVLGVRAWMGDRSQPLLERINAFVSEWGHRIVVWGLLIIGGALVLDAFGYFLGYPLLPTFD